MHLGLATVKREGEMVFYDAMAPAPLFTLCWFWKGAEKIHFTHTLRNLPRSFERSRRPKAIICTRYSLRRPLRVFYINL